MILLSVWVHVSLGLTENSHPADDRVRVAFTTSIYHGISTSRKTSKVQPPHRRFRSPGIRGRSEASPETLRKQQRPPRPFPPLNLLFICEPPCLSLMTLPCTPTTFTWLIYSTPWSGRGSEWGLNSMVMIPDTIGGSYEEKGRVKGTGECNPTSSTRELHGGRRG